MTIGGRGGGSSGPGPSSGPAAPLTVAELATSPNALAPHYSAFRVAERLLLTGHSHQAWPDVGLEAQRRAWLDAAEWIDDKWARVFERGERVARGYAELLGDADGDVALGASTHDLLVRFLSALPLRERPRIVTTDAEFHSLRRQVDRLAEAGLAEVVKVPAHPARSAGERVADAVDDRTACALLSAVFYDRGHVAGGLERAAEACARHGAELLVDAYHALGALPFRLDERGLERAYVVGGGYKYLQLGEGNAFLRIPPECRLRPVVTGWFGEFAELAEAGGPDEVRYGRGAARFAGATYDGTSHYRGAAVMDFFAERGLTPAFLRALSLHQVGLIAERFRELDLDPAVVRLEDDVAPEDRGGFLALDAPEAGRLSDALRARGVRADARGALLRLGPAPYLSDEQIERGVEALAEVVRG